MSKVSQGFFWSAIDHFSVQGLQFVLSIIIARLVSPSAYGAVVMVQVFISFAQVFIDGGFKSALIQKTDRSEKDFSTVFWFNMAVAILLYTIMFMVSPLISLFYDQPELTSLTRIVSLNLVFSSLSITQLVKLQASLDFKTQAKARVISVALSGIIGVICAYKELEAWALVIQSVICTLLTSLLLMHFSHWRPKLLFDRQSFHKLFNFGSKVLFSNFLTTIYMQISNLIIGKFYTPTQLAYYNRGFTLSNVPSVAIVEVMGRTIYPIFCEQQSEDVKLKQSYKKYLRLVNFIILPLMFGVCILSNPIISVLLTDKWIEAAPLLSIFCVAFATYPYQYITGNFILAIGKSGMLAKANIVKQGIAFTLLIGSLFISVKAVAYSLLIGNIINVMIGVYCVRKARGISMIEQFIYVTPILCITIISSLLVYIFSSFFSINVIKLCAGLLLYIISYFAICHVFKVEELNIIINIIKSLNKHV